MTVMGEATIFAQNAVKLSKIVMGGALSNHARVLAMKAPSDSMDAWAVTEGSENGMIETPRTDLREALIHFRVTRIQTKSMKADLDEMEQVEGGMSLHGSRTTTIIYQYLETERAMGTNL